MSSEEQATAIGKLVMEAADSRRRVTLLKSELEALSEALNSASLQINGVVQGIEYPDLAATANAIPSPARVMSTCEDYRTELKRSKELAARVASLGV